MNKHIYLIRHGAVDAAKHSSCIQQTKIELSPWGIAETELLRKWYDEGHSFSLYTSPLSPCKQTAEIIGGYGKKKSLISFIKDDTLMPIIEIDALREPGEPFKNAIDQIACKENNDLIVIAHVDVIKLFLSNVLNISLEELMKIPYPYLGMTILKVETEGYSLESEWSHHDKKNDWHLSKHGFGIIKEADNYHMIGQKPIEMLRQEELSHIYSECNTSRDAISKMELVSSYIDSFLSLIDADPECQEAELIRAAALTYQILPKKENNYSISAKYLRESGFSFVADLAEWTESVELANYPFLSLEELLFYADKRIRQNRFISIEEKFKTSLSTDIKLYNKAKLIQLKVDGFY